MSNQMITTENYNTQLTFLPEVEEIKTSKRQLAPTFKPYDNRQIQIIYDIELLIPEHHVARVVDEMIEAIPDEQLFSHYSGGGRSSYHPKMMLKVILFAYSQKVYSCRGIEQLTLENVPTMWLSAMQRPDYRTINEFRGKRMKSMIDELFETMVRKLIEDKYISMENYFLDGTKIEADANKYSFVWKKSIVKFEEKLKEKIQETLQHIAEMAKAEELEILGESLKDTELDPSQLEEIAVGLETHVAALSDVIEKGTNTEFRKEKRKRRTEWKKSLKLIREDFLPRLAQYKAQKEIFGDRNSYSKTDNDATFMR
ncbi:transposase, partial [Tepidibacillus fermentans]